MKDELIPEDALVYLMENFTPREVVRSIDYEQRPTEELVMLGRFLDGLATEWRKVMQARRDADAVEEEHWPREEG
jgi:hypothetical protein